MHLNSGYAREARRLGRRFVDDLRRATTPSSSPSSSLRRDGARDARPMEQRRSSCRSCSCTGSASRTSAPRFAGRVTYHPTCHSLRVTRVGDAPLRLLRQRARARARRAAARRRVLRLRRDVRDQERRHVERDARRQVRRDRVDRRASICTAVDSSCLLQIGGGLSRRGSASAPSTSPRSSRRRDDASREAARVELANAQLRANLRNATDTIRAKRAQRRRRAARLGGAPRRGQRDQGRRARAPRRLPAASSRPRSRQRAGTSTGRATPPRRTRSSSTSLARTASTRS